MKTLGMIVVALTFTLVAGSASAQAAQLHFQGGSSALIFQAKKGEANQVVVWQLANGDLAVQDQANPLWATDPLGTGIRCKRIVDPHTLDCGPVSSLTSFTVYLSDGNDSATINGLPNLGVDVRGGAGNNTLIGGDGPDFLKGHNGNDYLDGRGGANTLDVGGGVNTVVIHPGDLVWGLLDNDFDTCLEQGFTVVQPFNGCDGYASS